MSNYKIENDEIRKKTINNEIILTSLKADANRYAIAAAILIALFVLFLIGFYRQMNAARIIGMVLLAFIICALLCISITCLIKLSKQTFNVDIDTVDDIRLNVYKGMRRTAFSGRIVKRHNLLVFAKHGEYAPKQSNVLDRTRCGDTFYVVTYNEAPQEPIVIYSTKEYEWRE